MAVMSAAVAITDVMLFAVVTRSAIFAPSEVMVLKFECRPVNAFVAVVPSSMSARVPIFVATAAKSFTSDMLVETVCMFARFDVLATVVTSEMFDPTASTLAMDAATVSISDMDSSKSDETLLIALMLLATVLPAVMFVET